MIVMRIVFQPRNFGPPLLEGPKAPERAGPHVTSGYQLVLHAAYYFDMFSMGVFTTRHLQTTGRLVQKLNVCIVDYPKG